MFAQMARFQDGPDIFVAATQSCANAGLSPREEKYASFRAANSSLWYRKIWKEKLVSRGGTCGKPDNLLDLK
jgi:hypothetical protein